MSFLVTEEDAAAIQTALHAGGEDAAIRETLARFRFLDHDDARRWANTIATWKPLMPPASPAPARKRRRDG